MLIKQLEKEFVGTGQVSGFKFIQIHFTQYGFLYEVKQNDTLYHFEVFERKITPMCIDFEKRIYSETDFKEIYPKENDFGVWAWTLKSYDKAFKKINEIERKYYEKTN